MKIEQANVALKATHSFSRESDVTTETEFGFRRLFADQASLPESGRADPAIDLRISLMLASLIAKLLDAMSTDAGAKTADLLALLKAGKGVAEPVGEGGKGSVSIEWTTWTKESIREQETMDFSAVGTVQTCDGRSLAFGFGLNFCRDFQCEKRLLQGGSVRLRDPLVVNFDGKGCELSGKRFAFDLDVDGKNESIPGLAGSSGFLAIDRDGDGRIKDGSELFGAKSGNGFADLALLDGDGNGWLDENDPAFASLRVWRHDESGTDALKPLQEEGIGAVFLGAAASPFSVTDRESRLLASIRSTGVYLKENGEAGTLQQVDLSV